MRREGKESARDFAGRVLSEMSDTYLWVEHEGGHDSDDAAGEAQGIISSLVEERDAATTRAAFVKGLETALRISKSAKWGWSDGNAQIQDRIRREKAKGRKR